MLFHTVIDTAPRLGGIAGNVFFTDWFELVAKVSTFLRCSTIARQLDSEIIRKKSEINVLCYYDNSFDMADVSTVVF